MCIRTYVYLYFVLGMEPSTKWATSSALYIFYFDARSYWDWPQMASVTAPSLISFFFSLSFFLEFSLYVLFLWIDSPWIGFLVLVISVMLSWSSEILSLAIDWIHQGFPLPYLSIGTVSSLFRFPFSALVFVEVYAFELLLRQATILCCLKFVGSS